MLWQVSSFFTTTYFLQSGSVPAPVGAGGVAAPALVVVAAVVVVTAPLLGPVLVELEIGIPVVVVFPEAWPLVVKLLPLDVPLLTSPGTLTQYELPISMPVHDG